MFGDGSAFTRSMESATFGVPMPKILQKAADGVDALFESFVDDVSDLGDLYECMLSKLNTAGGFARPSDTTSRLIWAATSSRGKCPHGNANL